MKTQSSTKGFAILSAAGMIVKLLSLFYLPFLLPIIGKEATGNYYAAYTVFVFIYIITNTGFSSAISKIVSELVALENYKDAVKAFKISRFLLIVLGSVMGLIMLIFAKFFAETVVSFPKSYLAIAALSPAVLFTAIASSYRGYFQGRGDMKATAVSQVIEQVVNIVFSLLFAALWVKYGVEAACAGGTIGTTLGALVAAIYLMFYYKNHRKFKVSKDYNAEEIIRYSNEELLKKIIRYALPMSLCWGLQYGGNLVDTKNTKSRLFVAGFSETNGSIMNQELAKYQTLINVPIAIISALSAAIFPAISAAVALKDKEGIRKGINYAFRLCFLISIPSAVGLAVLGEPIYSTLRYDSGIALMKYGSVVVVLMAVVQIQTTILQGIGKLYLSTFYIVLGILGKIAVNYYLIAMPTINILGAIYGTIIGFLIPLILNNWLIKRSLKIKFSLFNSAIKPIVASGLMGAVAYVFHFDIMYVLNFISKGYISNIIATATAIALAGVTYFYALILIGGITQKDLDSMPRKIIKFIPKFMIKRIR